MQPTDDDAVCKAGKFGVLYKHCGNRVIINTAGDMIVRPSFLEMAVRGRYRASVAQHLLSSYHASFKAVMKAQVGTAAVLFIQPLRCLRI